MCFYHHLGKCLLVLMLGMGRVCVCMYVCMYVCGHIVVTLRCSW